MPVSQITNLTNRKFGDPLEVVDGSTVTRGRFLAASVDETGRGTVWLTPDGSVPPEVIEVDTATAEVYAVTADTEWVPVQDDEMLTNQTVRFRHRLSESVVYATNPLTHDEAVLGSGWAFTVQVCPGGAQITVNDEYWILEREVPVLPLYQMPTAPGVYTSANGDVWQHDPGAGWDRVWRNLTKQASGTADDARPFGPFVGPLS